MTNYSIPLTEEQEGGQTEAVEPVSVRGVACVAVAQRNLWTRQRKDLHIVLHPSTTQPFRRFLPLPLPLALAAPRLPPAAAGGACSAANSTDCKC